MGLRLVLMLWIGIVSSVQSQNCPDGCHCSNSTVRCMFTHLDNIPAVPASTETLDLRFNKIQRIPSHAFKNLGKLHTLLLNNNQIRTISDNAFSDLTALKTLYLYKNFVETISENALSGLHNLKHLYLHHNLLTQLPAKIFLDLNSVERIFLHNNKLESLPKDTFKNTPFLERLRIDGNPLRCDCHLAWLIPIMNEKEEIVQAGATCAQPANLENRTVVSLQSDDLPDCFVSDKQKPMLIEEPEDVVASGFETVRFLCKAEGNPSPEIIWMHNSQPIEMHSAANHDHFRLKDDGTLMIDRPSKRDEGLYQCMAKNEVGEFKSRLARMVYSVQRDEVPEYDLTPQDQTAVEGTTVQFTCSANGTPNPKITWAKNGVMMEGSDRLVVREGRLIIHGVRKSDQGTYMCRAQNSAGTRDEAADLVVLESGVAVFTRRPFDVIINVGSPLRLPCEAGGMPKPAISWTKSGSLIEDDRIRVSSTGDLIIESVRVGDGGLYECRADNGREAIVAVAYVSISEVTNLRPVSTSAETRRSSNYVSESVDAARREVDRAINETLVNLFSPVNRTEHPNNIGDFFRLLRFPNPSVRQIARSAEIYERAIQLLRAHVQNSAGYINSTNDYSHHDDQLIPVESVRLLATLSGCMTHRTTVADCEADICFNARYRTFDGTCNNIQRPMQGASETAFKRLLKPSYENGFNLPVGWSTTKLHAGGQPLPSARLVSATVISTTHISSDDFLSHMAMQWGQFLDHDLDMAPPTVSTETFVDRRLCSETCDSAPPCFPIPIPAGDTRIRSRPCMEFTRSAPICGSGYTSALMDEGLMHREQINVITSYIDASQVYGSSEAEASNLRDHGTERIGWLRPGIQAESGKHFMPFAENWPVDCRRNRQESDISCFQGGDIRVNEQLGLIAIHTVWFREHNRLAQRLSRMNKRWDSDTVYQEARKIVWAQMQHITYQQWLPAVLGPTGMEMLGPYKGYKPAVDASVANVFATAALRFGHTLINPILHRLNGSYLPIPQGHISLGKSFFSPFRIFEEGGIDPLLRGLIAVSAKLKKPDELVNSELTERLFNQVNEIALDLAAINIQRGRDHGLQGYNAWRRHCHLAPAETFDDFSDEIKSSTLRTKLKELYGHPDNVDVWVGGISEDSVPGAKVGPTFMCLIVDQFRRLRDGDRFYYEHSGVFSDEQLIELKRATLSRILCDNGDNIRNVTLDAFLVPKKQSPSYVPCDQVPKIDLKPWVDCGCQGCSGQKLNNLYNAGKFKRSLRANSSAERKGRREARKHKLQDRLAEMEVVVQELTSQVHQLTARVRKLEEMTGSNTKREVL